MYNCFKNNLLSPDLDPFTGALDLDLFADALILTPELDPFAGTLILTPELDPFAGTLIFLPGLDPFACNLWNLGSNKGTLVLSADLDVFAGALILSPDLDPFAGALILSPDRDPFTGAFILSPELDPFAGALILSPDLDPFACNLWNLGSKRSTDVFLLCVSLLFCVCVSLSFLLKKRKRDPFSLFCVQKNELCFVFCCVSFFSPSSRAPLIFLNTKISEGIPTVFSSSTQQLNISKNERCARRGGEKKRDTISPFFFKTKERERESEQNTHTQDISFFLLLQNKKRGSLSLYIYI